jgi:16S rRNA (adenine1518-N6/adenine1519-N6)-dimethyltransferase
LVNAHRPRRRFAQHFLVDRGVIGSIVELVRPKAGDVVVEIGPGRGALTDALVASVDRLVAVEIDRDLAATLRERLGAKGLHVIEGDILEVDLGEILRDEGGDRLLIVGNLPYNITAPLIFHFLAQADHIDRAIIMVQREVARRLAAGPGSKDYSLLSVLVAMRAEVEPRLQVERRCFRPVPAVDSAVIELRFAAGPRFAVEDVACFDRLVRRAFGQRRKMLRNSLLGLNPQGGRSWLEELGQRAGIELTRRPEELSIEEFIRLSDACQSSGDTAP